MPMTDQQIDALAGALVAARRPGAAPVATPDVPPATQDEAYRVQDAVLARLGPAAGWKVGAASNSADPSCAPILSGGVGFAGRHPVIVPSRAGVEIEIAFRIARTFPASLAAPTRDAVLAAIGSAHVVIETCARRVADKSATAPPLLLLADNIQNHGLVIGPLVEGWRALDGDKLTARMTADGRLLGETTGGHTAKDLLRLLVWQVGHCVTRRGGLPAGTIVTTGAWTGMHMVDAPARIVAEFPALGRIEIALAV